MSATHQGPDEPGELRRIFDAVVELPAEERSAMLAKLCGGRTALRERIERMLIAAEEAPPLLREPQAFARSQMAQLAGVEQIGDHFGPYELVGLIQEGGFGRVWRARQVEPLQRTVALKILKVGIDSERSLVRFQNEWHALAQMQHPHIARVFDAGATPEGRPYFAMELVEGEVITRYSARVSLRERLQLFEQVCRAVQHAHEQGFVHRDLKPDNVLVQVHDGDAFARVIDFGIAKVLTDAGDAGTAQAGEWLLGSLGYMSPEQAGDASGVDARADVYALGAILYELVAGVPAADLAELRQKGPLHYVEWVRGFEPVPPSERCLHEIVDCEPGDLDRVVIKAMARNRDGRYATAKELADDVRRILDREPIAAEGAWVPAAWRPLGAVLAIVLLGSALLLGDLFGGANRVEARPSLLSELMANEWTYRDPLYPPGDSVTFRPDGEGRGRFHPKWKWTFVVLDEQTLGIDFWNDGESVDLELVFDVDRQRAEGDFTGHRGRTRRIALVRD